MLLPPPPRFSTKDSKEGLKTQPIAISLGVSPYSPWDLEMANLGYKVLQYDASIEVAPYKHENITFFKKFVGVENSDDTLSLQNVITQNALNTDAFNILQCDIEDCEWDILEHIDLSLVAKYFPQVLFEFHNCNPESDALSAPRLKILSKIREFYTPIFTHYNNYAPAYFAGGDIFCDVIEITYIRNDLVPKDSILFTGILNINGLSATNAYPHPDLPVIF